jgi:FHA domain
MLGAGRHHVAAGAVLVTLAWGAGGVGAEDFALIARCAPAQPVETAPAAPGSPAPERSKNTEATATVTCDLRATSAAHFKGVKATVKGKNEAIAARFTPFDPNDRSLTVLFLIQIMEAGRRADAVAMADTVIALTEVREGKRRFAVYSVGNDLNLVADFGAAKADFDRQVRAIRNVRVRTQLFKNTLDAIAKLARESGDRKALIILGDGTSDDPPAGYNHEQVVAAATKAGVAIHALGYFDESADLPKFQIIRRLADDTGGFRREVRVGGVQKFAISREFVGDVLGNGGEIRMTLREAPGPIPITISADFGDAGSANVEQQITIPPPPAIFAPAVPAAATVPKAWQQRLRDWLATNRAVALVLGVATVLGAAGVGLFALSKAKRRAVGASDPEAPDAVYGWLDMLDANASRYPLQTTNVRIGRHRDNDICLQNDSISRRHALLHFNADNRRFIITDLGGNNGVIVNNIKQQSHELNDGDLVELGEVRLRFRSNVETTS